MLQAKAKLDGVDSIDEVADAILHNALKAIPDVLAIAQLRADIELAFERSVAELVRSRK